MGKPLRVLLVEDCEDDAELTRRALRRHGYDVTSTRVHTGASLEYRGADAANGTYEKKTNETEMTGAT